MMNERHYKYITNKTLCPHAVNGYYDVGFEASVRKKQPYDVPPEVANQHARGCMHTSGIVVNIND